MTYASGVIFKLAKSIFATNRSRNEITRVSGPFFTKSAKWSHNGRSSEATLMGEKNRPFKGRFFSAVRFRYTKPYGSRFAVDAGWRQIDCESNGKKPFDSDVFRLRWKHRSSNDNGRLMISRNTVAGMSTARQTTRAVWFDIIFRLCRK